MVRTFCLLALLVTLAGCSPGASARKKMEGPQTPSWPALEALRGDAGIINIGMSMQTQGPKGAQRAAAAPSFVQVVDNLDKEAIPSEFATTEREAAKKAFVEAARQLAKAASDDEIKTLWETMRKNMEAMGQP